MKKVKIKKYLFKESVWFLVIAMSLIVISFLGLSLVISGTLAVFKEQMTNFFIWNGWEATSVIALIITAFYIGQQSYFTRRIFQFQTIPSIAFALMSNRTFFEKIGMPYHGDGPDIHFMIHNLSKFPVSFWIKIKDNEGNQLHNGGPWRINPMTFFKPHSPDLMNRLSESQITEIYVTISYSSLHDDKLKVSERPERWRLGRENRRIDRHGMEDVNDRSWDSFLIGFRQRPDQKGADGI